MPRQQIGPCAATRRRLWLAATCLALVAAVGGIKLSPKPVPRVEVNFITEPFEATIYLDGALATQLKRRPFPDTVYGAGPARRGASHRLQACLSRRTGRRPH